VAGVSAQAGAGTRETEISHRLSLFITISRQRTYFFLTPTFTAEWPCFGCVTLIFAFFVTTATARFKVAVFLDWWNFVEDPPFGRPF
jgi:hypothetical protein